MYFVNATPHDVRISDGKGSFLTISPSGRPARVRRDPELTGSVDLLGVEVPFYTAPVTGITGLPPVRDGYKVIVSAEVAREARHTRSDLVAPYRFVRNENGLVEGCHALVTFI